MLRVPNPHVRRDDGVHCLNVKLSFSRTAMPSWPHSSRFHSTQTCCNPSSTMHRMTKTSSRKKPSLLRTIAPDHAPQIHDINPRGDHQLAICAVRHADHDHIARRYELLLGDEGRILRELVGVVDPGAVKPQYLPELVGERVADVVDVGLECHA